MASSPVVPVFPAGYGPYYTDFDNWVQAPFAALTSRVVFRAAKTTSQTLSAGTNTIAFNSILEDPYSGWNSGTNTWTPPAAWSGTYIVKAGIVTGGLSSTRIVVAVGLNGTSLYTLGAVWTNSSLANAACGDVPVQLVGGVDQVSVLAIVPTAVNLDITSGQQSTCEITWYSN